MKQPFINMKSVLLLVLSMFGMASLSCAQTIQADPDLSGTSYTYYVYEQQVTLTFQDSPQPPQPPPCSNGTEDTWVLVSSDYSWTGDVSNPTDSNTATLNTGDTPTSLSVQCDATYSWAANADRATKASTRSTATGQYGTGPTTENISIDTAVCGNAYGAMAHYTYTRANGWFAAESVAAGQMGCAGNVRVNQHQNPAPMAQGGLDDTIHDNNGPPSNVANCSDTNPQTIFVGPTQAQFKDCSFQHTITIQVQAAAGSPGHGTVTTAVNGASTSCNY